jgi:hypothetical protein
MRRVLLLTACVALAGCLGTGKQAKVEPKSQPKQVAYTKDCYTVDLFTDVKVEKAPEGVPERYTRFLGKWGGDAWKDVWCHDLLVNRVYADGQVELVDMHAPYEPWNQPATAFQRVGWIDDKGRLHFNHGEESAVYEIKNGKLHGTRTFKWLGTLEIQLHRRGVPPVPVPRPAPDFRVAQAAQT